MYLNGFLASLNKMSLTVQELEYAAVAGKEAGDVSNLYKEDSQGEIDSIFYSKIKPIAWYSMTPSKFEGSPSKYTPQVGSDYVMYSYLSATVPALAVKPEYADTYRIGWTLNLLHEIVNKASCRVNEFELQSIDNVWLSMEAEYFLKPGTEYTYDKGIGNTPDLQDYSVMLPRKRLKIRQPWFYGRHPGSAFPLYILGSLSTFSHTYDYTLEIENLLKMQRLVDGRWVNIKPDTSILNGIPNTSRLETPQLYGNFAKISSDEKDFNSCDPNAFIYFVENVVNCDKANSESVGSVVDADLECQDLTRAIFWASRNVSSAEYNIKSNYTTSWDNPQHGDSAIGQVTLKYGKSNKFTDLDPDNFCNTLTEHHFIRNPRHDGFYAYPFSYNTSNIGVELGVKLKSLGAKLSTVLTDPSTTKWKNGHHDVRGRDVVSPATNDKFQLVVRLLTIRKLKVDASTGQCLFVV